MYLLTISFCIYFIRCQRVCSLWYSERLREVSDVTFISEIKFYANRMWLYRTAYIVFSLALFFTLFKYVSKSGIWHSILVLFCAGAFAELLLIVTERIENRVNVPHLGGYPVLGFVFIPIFLFILYRY